MGMPFARTNRMTSRKFLFVFFIVLASRGALADIKFLERSDGTIKITTAKPWEWGDRGETVCFVRNVIDDQGKPDEKTIACGEVTDSTADWAIVDIGPDVSLIHDGDKAQNYQYTRLYFAFLTVGADAGTGYFFPHAHFQFKITRQWYLGVKMSYSSSDENLGYSIKTLGTFVTLNHYTYRKPFPGFWWQLFGGAYNISRNLGASEQPRTAPAIGTTVGWRGVFFHWITVGAGVGVQWIGDPFNGPPAISLQGFKPLVTGDIGVRF